MAKIQNIFYAQSGGVTATINASASSVIDTADKNPNQFGKVLVGKNGIIGALCEELIDVSKEEKSDLLALYHTPAGAFGSCRYKLKSIDEEHREYQRLIEVFQAHNIGYFFYNGGGDSQDTANKVNIFSRKMGYDLTCIGIPKTIDNDLPITDNCPGFGSVAKYIAISALEAELDVISMRASSTKVFIMEVMGRHAGWIAASASIGARNRNAYITLFPEIAFDQEKFIAQVDINVKRYGYSIVIVSEGVKDSENRLLSASKSVDPFGHVQLGGVGSIIAKIIDEKLKFKSHFAICDYLQRAARHIASRVDVEQSYAVGKAACEFALQGKNGIMPIIVRKNNQPYEWEIGETDLATVANVEKKVPRDFISANGFNITEKCYLYILPLINGEDYPPYQEGLPCYVELKNLLVEKKLKPYCIHTS